jgi:hypothetical protein
MLHHSCSEVCSGRSSSPSSPRPRVKVTLGRHEFWIAPGRTAMVNVKLTGRGFKLLVRVKRLPTQVRISYKQPAGGSTPATRTITLTAPKAVRPRGYGEPKRRAAGAFPEFPLLISRF